MKMKNFPTYTTSEQPEGCKRIAQVPEIVFDAAANGYVGTRATALFAALHLDCNFHTGKGTTTLRTLCEQLRIHPSNRNINNISKDLSRMREQRLIWYPRRTGSKTFSYVLYGYKFKESDDAEPKYIDIEKYFHADKQNTIRTLGGTGAVVTPMSPPRNPNFERPQNGSIKSISDVLSER